jgi:hypothetical protein
MKSRASGSWSRTLGANRSLCRGSTGFDTRALEETDESRMSVDRGSARRGMALLTQRDGQEGAITPQESTALRDRFTNGPYLRGS